MTASSGMVFELDAADCCILMALVMKATSKMMSSMARENSTQMRTEVYMTAKALSHFFANGKDVLVLVFKQDVGTFTW